MKLIRLLKETIISLYKGLFYWFFWASFVTLNDEMFGTNTNPSKQSANLYEQIANNGDTNMEQPQHKAICRIFIRHLKEQTHNKLRRAYDRIMATNLANLRALMDAAKELPQRHLVRISIYSG